MKDCDCDGMGEGMHRPNCAAMTAEVSNSRLIDGLNAKRIERADAVITDHLATLYLHNAPEEMTGVHEVVLKVLRGEMDDSFGI